AAAGWGCFSPIVLPTPALGRVAQWSQAPPRRALLSTPPHVGAGCPSKVGPAWRSGQVLSGRFATHNLFIMPYVVRQSEIGLLQNLSDAPRTNGAATLTDGETETVLHRDGLDQRHSHLSVVTRHDHLGTLRQRDDTGNVRSPEVELRTVVVEERR